MPEVTKYSEETSPHFSMGAFGPVYYRWECARMLPVTYPEAQDGEVTMEFDVGQVAEGLLPPDAEVGEAVWSVYGRRNDDNLADWLADFNNSAAAHRFCCNLGASATDMLPGPIMYQNGHDYQRRVYFFNEEKSKLRWQAADLVERERMLSLQIAVGVVDRIKGSVQAMARQMSGYGSLGSLSSIETHVCASLAEMLADKARKGTGV